MAVSKIELVGTENLTSANRLLVYNTETFHNEDLVARLGLPKIEEISLSSANNILESLKSSGYYPLLNKPFTYINDKDSLLAGQGFDTILFLRDKTLLGYAYLGKSYGETYSFRGTTFIVDSVKITVLGDNNSLQIGNDIIKFDMEINNQTPRTESLEKEPRDYKGRGNYGVFIRDFLKGNKKDIFTDSAYIKYGEYAGRVSFNSLELPGTYSDFRNTQIGFYQGDPSLYIWNDDNQYSIFSLTKKISFSDDLQIPKAYTVAKADLNGDPISKSEVYSLPDLERGPQRILGFFGQYCIVEADEEKYILDIPRQNSPLTNGPLNKGWLITGKEIIKDSYLAYTLSSSGWIPTYSNDAPIFDSLDIATGDVVRVPEWKPIYLNNFVIDQSIRAKICEINSFGWKNYQEALKEVGSLCNTYIGSKSLVESGYQVVKKIGDWFIFESPVDNTYLYSNMTQTLKTLKTEKPIIVNDEILLNIEGEGEYVLYDSPGSWISQNCFNQLYTVDEEGNKIVKGFFLSSKKCTIQSKESLSKSFFNTLRRNIMPTTVSGISIVGALSGIIFYRIKNTINYL